MRMKKSKKIALCAILSAFGVLALFLGAVLDVLSMTMVAVASLFVVVVMIEIGHPYPWLIWGVTSALSMILLPNKLPAILYLLFGGIYPILKEYFERMHPVVCWIFKLSMINTALLAVVVATKYIFYLNDSSFDFTLPFLAMGNVALILYDIALSKLILLYIVKMRRHMGLKNYFEN
ncbi:MAG: hypothetical protein IJC98_08910 [Clostridia bacterium]|nr:hypothetical protein [Clostridia bacterium]